MSHTGLPDPDTACRAISEAVPEFGPRIARQASVHAEVVSRFLDRRRLRTSSNEAKHLIREIIGPFGTNSASTGTWYGRMNHILSGFYPTDGPDSWDPGGIRETLYPALQTLDNKPDLWLSRASDSELRTVLSELHRRLTTLADSLPRSVRRPALLPGQHPPKFARLRDTVVAESVAEELATLIDAGVEQYEAARSGGWAGSSRESALSQRFESALDPFLTQEVFLRYKTATRGFEHLEIMAGGRSANLTDPLTRPAYREIADGIHQQLYSSYIAIAVNYLAEVLELMPDYAEASGQGKRRDPVTVYGNVGAINSQVTNSHLSVAQTVTSIGATVQAVADRGETNIADAIRALAEAVQHAPELTEDQRAELLDNVADVADAAAAPDEPRRLSRARAAIAMITNGAGASTQLAEAVRTWHQVAGQLF